MLNALFNTLAYQPKGQQSYLFWGSWLAHIADSLTSGQDAHGPVVRGLFMATCSGLNLFEVGLANADPAAEAAARNCSTRPTGARSSPPSARR